MDKRLKMVLAGFCICAMLVSCMEERDVMPDLDLQELNDSDGIDQIRYGGNEKDTTRVG